MGTDFPPLPSDAARIRALEALVGLLSSRIEQIGMDLTDSLRQLATHQTHSEARLHAQFEQVEDNRAAMELRILTVLRNILDERSPPKEE